ncbi:MAG TPA: hypothetical protein VMT35_06065 [Ignavibacteriaceae bacterium]|nr:hypothetical protein [Ignavibacteriaceae bacterium]
MAILGTKKFWKPTTGASAVQKENQILKNAGYINLQLQTVNYMSVGNFWQSTFGGKDKIALATTLKYQSGVDSIEATAVQDVREVEVNKNYNLGLQRYIAVKIPANADAIGIEVRMTAVKNDSLQAKFDMLNKPEYQSALQLAPTVVGQVLTISSLVKKLFTDSDPHSQLEASYAGVISIESEDNPVSSGKLTKGLLIMISTNDGDEFKNVDETKFELRGDTLYYKNRQIENTYLVFNISFEQLKGDDEKSNWFKKYNDALNNLDKIQLTTDQGEIAKIFSDTKTLWIEGNALIDADATYINSERIKIKSAAIKTIKDKYNSLTQTAPPQTLTSPTEILKGLTGSADFKIVKEALPVTGSFINEKLDLDPSKPVDNLRLSDLFKHETKLEELINRDTEDYLNKLKKNKIKFNLSQLK